MLKELINLWSPEAVREAQPEVSTFRNRASVEEPDTGRRWTPEWHNDFGALAGDYQGPAESTSCWATDDWGSSSWGSSSFGSFD